MLVPLDEFCHCPPEWVTHTIVRGPTQIRSDFDCAGGGLRSYQPLRWGRSIDPSGSVPLWFFSSRIPFIRKGGLSKAMTYLDGRVMVIVELLAGWFE
jgi:hypothetical protein